MKESVTVGIPYTVDTGEKLVNETFGPNNIRRRRTGTHELKRMEVRNGRLIAGQLSLDEQGFVLVEHKTKVTDFFDPAQLKSVYYPEVEQLIKDESGASRVVIFDHTLRSGDEAEREAKLIREPVLSAHNDYTEWSGPNRLREVLPNEAEELLKNRFAIIQVWRAINQPIQSNPLAIADGKSVDMEDLIVAERRYPHDIFLRLNVPTYRGARHGRDHVAIRCSTPHWPIAATGVRSEKQGAEHEYCNRSQQQQKCTAFRFHQLVVTFRLSKKISAGAFA